MTTSLSVFTELNFSSKHFSILFKCTHGHEIMQLIMQKEIKHIKIKIELITHIKLQVKFPCKEIVGILFDVHVCVTGSIYV